VRTYKWQTKRIKTSTFALQCHSKLFKTEAVEHNLVVNFNNRNMKCLILLTLFVLASCEVKEEKDVLVATTDNWDEVVNDKTTVLVEFCKYNNYIHG